ncbi:MAG TPA: hypothetical protein ENK35_10530 [Candidatus Tenderia sp.]|nr:hypothetical protein [Candidatus Tenderia sp.]
MVAVKYFGGAGLKVAIGTVLMLSLLIFSLPAFSNEDAPNSVDDSTAVMEIFNEQAIAEQEAFELSDNEKHQILFVMGIALLVLLGATAYFGIAMGVGGKDVFVPHMISAGLAITLSLAHAVTAVVWFYPF